MSRFWAKPDRPHGRYKELEQRITILEKQMAMDEDITKQMEFKKFAAVIEQASEEVVIADANGNIQSYRCRPVDQRDVNAFKGLP